MQTQTFHPDTNYSHSSDTTEWTAHRRGDKRTAGD